LAHSKEALKSKLHNCPSEHNLARLVGIRYIASAT